jgi:putative DNA primase/helicase
MPLEIFDPNQYLQDEDIDLNFDDSEFNPPKGYACTDKGVHKVVEDDDNIMITLDPVQVTAVSRNENNDDWKVLVWWKDMDKKVHEVTISKHLFHVQGTEIAQLLARGGLRIVPGKERELARYLTVHPVERRLLAASSTGWMGNAFVLPNVSVRETKNERIVYQPAGLSNISKSISSKGTLKDWKDGIKDASPMVIFAICASLSAPVRYIVNIEAGGFHFSGVTSTGKTTLLQVAASTFGNGVDPGWAGGATAYIQRWNTTANALEAKAEAFNDLPMVIDEIGEGDSREFGQTIYRIISGTGRGRANREGGLRDSKSWRVTILSAGEVAISDFIESGGKKLKGGQVVRMVDINLDAVPHLFNSAAEADKIKNLCATHYGHAGVAMLESIPNLAYEWKLFDHEQIGSALTNIAKRVRTRFALAAYTGVIAVDAGILPWTKEQILCATQTAYSAWHDQISIVSDVDRGVKAVRDFIMQHASRFESDDDRLIPRDRAGWLRDCVYHFIPCVFKEVCTGVDATKVKRELHSANLLHINKSKGFNSSFRVNGKITTVVAVKSEILESSKNGSNGSNGGNTLSATRDISNRQSGNAVATGSYKTKGVTTCNHQESQVVTAGCRMDKGLLPPSPLLPPKNDEAGIESDKSINDDKEYF